MTELTKITGRSYDSAGFQDLLKKESCEKLNEKVTKR